ncbi:DUF368 domain-containing protein [Dasania sp. GY-MA-18]|uniref:DUF368 domain-containing protein n=1 Tax=Dasania phycosphaerae TaxID=2950436 RepID=A0A9J6RPI3_9GAMM|nr:MULTISPECIES: DUF368 domain-containing protein [Dasania]MCR8923994.1 DUF368 domain-containing protein [Dasania sp. GY-MA-18]MCZ0866428.1 DUF368 domain-containing protein [Dasania phycosphaerae]MCZ0870152.1 DUF368 domain-containing protein [Dasania phycosphaerae]
MSLIGIYLRGLAMGAADVVPGVSGGTIAFITGIYGTLLEAIKSLTPRNLRLITQQGFSAFWETVNGSFLLVLLLGIVTSILSLARVISYLLDQHPLLIWSFFFGLIIASALHVGKQIKNWRGSYLLMLLLGIALAVLITELKPSELTASPWIVFAAGSIAICAMILPGISGSFLLVLMGLYGPILAAVKDLNLVLISCFAAGCGLGLLSFAHLLSWLLARFYYLTMSLLTGFLLGSLNLVWPWKQTLSTYTNSKGKELALEQANRWPGDFELLTQQPAQTVSCITMAVAGVALVLLLEKISSKNTKAS